MTESMENIVLEQLRLIRATLEVFSERMERVEIRLGVIKQRLSAIELRMADFEVTMRKRIDRIERRLDLTEGLPAQD